MKRKYEGLIVLDTRGKEDTVDTIVSKIGRDMELEAEMPDVGRALLVTKKTPGRMWGNALNGRSDESTSILLPQAVASSQAERRPKLPH